MRAQPVLGARDSKAKQSESTARVRPSGQASEGRMPQRMKVVVAAERQRTPERTRLGWCLSADAPTPAPDSRKGELNKDGRSTKAQRRPVKRVRACPGASVYRLTSRAKLVL